MCSWPVARGSWSMVGSHRHVCSVCSDYGLCAGMCAGKFVANKRMQVPDSQTFNPAITKCVQCVQGFDHF